MQRRGAMPFTIGPRIHNVVPGPLRRLIDEFFRLTDWKGLCLSGGTCLAEYYFGHRISIDMDIFALEEAVFHEAQLSLKDARSFSSGRVTAERIAPHLAQFLFHPEGEAEPIKIDLMLDLPIRLSPPLKVGDVWIDSLDDLLANKLGCLIQRSDAKDYIDLFYLISASHLTARELIDLGCKKEGGLDPLIAAQQIEFIFQSPRPPAQFLGQTDWNELQFFFGKLQKEFLELIRPK